MSGYDSLPNEAQRGSEYGGAPSELLYNTIQPKPAEAIDAGEQLRLGYTTGEETDWRSLEDRRQMMGLRPAGGRHPEWLTHVSPTNNPALTSEAERQGYRDEE